jgi:acetate kinase
MSIAVDSILTVNIGSSSVRLDMFRLKDSGLVRTHAHNLARRDAIDSGKTLDSFIHTVGVKPAAIAHRIVHGGETLVLPQRVNANLERTIERLKDLAPLHNPPALEWIRLCRERLPDCFQVAVCDTAFYAGMPDVARTYPIDSVMARRHGLRRYGFHGLAHDAMCQRWCELAPRLVRGGRILSLHLGSGCSITAIHNGCAIDTSMGYSPLEGLVMATRSGDIDPGLLMHLQRKEGMSPQRMEQWLNDECGLLGVSGVSADMQELLLSGMPMARLAVQLFCYRARKYVGAFLAALGGADAVLIGGGIGEHAPEVRAAILRKFEWAGLHVDAAANNVAKKGDVRISSASSQIQVWVLTVDEAARMAHYAVRTLAENT